jgi:Ca2+-binding EF-hand superfamily protein
MKALDADADGEISAAEIESASTALKSIDKNNDGKLTLDELRPEFARGREGRRNRSGQAGEGERGPRGPRGGRGRGPAGGVDGEGPSPERMVERMMQFDEDGDGELSKDEMPERMQSMLARVDTDNSDSISKDEITKMAERMRQRGQHGGGRRQRPAGAGPNSPPQPPVE